MDKGHELRRYILLVNMGGNYFDSQGVYGAPLIDASAGMRAGARDGINIGRGVVYGMTGLLSAAI